jgi:hypothetical protein
MSKFGPWHLSGNKIGCLFFKKKVFLEGIFLSCDKKNSHCQKEFNAFFFKFHIFKKKGKERGRVLNVKKKR